MLNGFEYYGSKYGAWTQNPDMEYVIDFRPHWNSLSTEGELVILNGRIFVPENCREKTLKNLHIGRPRYPEIPWWPQKRDTKMLDRLLTAWYYQGHLEDVRRIEIQESNIIGDANPARLVIKADKNELFKSRTFKQS